jgi:hypothetical protein
MIASRREATKPVSGVGTRSRPWIVLAVAVGLALLASAPASGAVIPGVNGLLAVGECGGNTEGMIFGGDICTLQPDGSQLHRITSQKTDNEPAWSPDGTKLAFVRTDSAGHSHIEVVHADGSGLKAVTKGQSDDSPAWSPDGSKIAFVRGGQLHVVDVLSGATKRLDAGPRDGHPSWSADGSKIAFDSGTAPAVIEIINAAGGQPHELVPGIQPAWSPSDPTLAYTRFQANGDTVISLIDGIRGGASRDLTAGHCDDSPAWSPDARRIAFVRGTCMENAAVWVMDANGSHQTRVVAGFNPDWQAVPSGGPCAEGEVKFGNVDALGSFTQGAHGTCVSHTSVRINGIDFVPKAGGSVELDPAALGLRATGSGSIKVGPVTVRGWNGVLDLSLSKKLPAFTGRFSLLGIVLGQSLDLELSDKGAATFTGMQTVRLLDSDAVVNISVTTSNASRLSGAEIRVQPADADPKVHELSSCSFKKPAPVGFRCATVTNQKGNTYSGLVANSPGIVKLGFLPVAGLDLSYNRADGTGKWKAQGSVVLGDILPGPSFVAKALPTLGLGATFEVSPFKLDSAHFEISDLNLGLGPATLKHASFDLTLHPNLEVAGQAGLVAGPGDAVSIDAGFSYKRGDQSGFDLRLNGTYSVKNELSVQGYVEYDGRKGLIVRAGGQFDKDFGLGPVSATVSLRIDGAFARGGDFQLIGDGSASVWGQSLGLKGVVSNAGIGACGHISVFLFSGEIGFKHFWDGETDFNGCDFGGLYTVPGASTAQGATKTVTLAARLAREEIAVVGSTGPPFVTLTGPHGEQLVTPLTPNKLFATSHGLAIAVTGSRTTYFIVQRPAAGAWHITPAAGGAPPIRVRRADPLLPANVTAEVKRETRGRVLQWHSRPQHGQRITFLELGAGIDRSITTSSRAQGRVRFTPTTGPGGTRHIEALIFIDGFLRSQQTVATFHVSPPSPPRVRSASYRVRRNRVMVRWSPVPGAIAYDLVARLTNATLDYHASHTQSITILLPRHTRLLRISIKAITNRLTGPAKMVTHSK